MFNAIEFMQRTRLDRPPESVHINPRYVMLVAPYRVLNEQTACTRVTLSHGEDIFINAPPAEVLRQLRGGSLC